MSTFNHMSGGELDWGSMLGPHTNSTVNMMITSIGSVSAQNTKLLETVAQRDEEIAKLRSQHEAEIRKLSDEHEMEVSELKMKLKQYEDKETAEPRVTYEEIKIAGTLIWLVGQ